jgi:hypothetical protein
MILLMVTEQVETVTCVHSASLIVLHLISTLLCGSSWFLSPYLEVFRLKEKF